MENPPIPEKEKHAYTTGEEIANSVTHGVGALLGAAALALLVTFASQAGDVWRVVSFSVYGVTIIALFLCSTLYHSLTNPRAKAVFRVLDHISIFLLIAGTYTPFMLVSIRGAWGWSLFGVVWGLAVTGVILKTFFTGRFEVLSLIIYIAMGWLVVIAFKPMAAALETGGLVLLVTGGVLYTVGVVFYVWERLPYNHAIWHLFVLAGAICQFFSVLLFVH